jgi:hypothetical protein
MESGYTYCMLYLRHAELIENISLKNTIRYCVRILLLRVPRHIFGEGVCPRRAMQKKLDAFYFAGFRVAI